MKSQEFKYKDIYSESQLIEIVESSGFLPLLYSGIDGFSADDIVASDCRYITFPDGGWDWPMWKWKGSMITDGGLVYGKFFNKKAGFVSRDWWQELCNYRRNTYPKPAEDSIEDIILCTLKENGSMITRDLRHACGFDGKGMRSKFDGYVTNLQMSCRIVTEDFIYPTDRHGKEYGWGWALLNTPEELYGRDLCSCKRTPEESFMRIKEHLTSILPNATEKQIERLIR